MYIYTDEKKRAFTVLRRSNFIFYNKNSLKSNINYYYIKRISNSEVNHSEVP